MNTEYACTIHDLRVIYDHFRLMIHDFNICLCEIKKQ